MSPSEFRTSIAFIAEKVFPRMGISKAHTLTIEYLGGEVLLVPESELRDNVEHARSVLSPFVRHIRDGAQSNLINTPRRVLALHDMFSGNIGTSWDEHTDQRQVGGSAQLYRTMLHANLAKLESERGCRPGRVIVADAHTLPHLAVETQRAIDQDYDLVIRPVFEGGSEDISPASLADLRSAFLESYAIWARQKTSRIEPFYSLWKRRVNRGTAEQNLTAGCPFQSDCAFKSLALDPDGSLWVCQEMADSKNYCLGNAVEGKFNENTWKILARRSARLSQDCTNCQWLSECGGGCMNESINRFSDPFAKTELCPLWKDIFRAMEQDISGAQP